MMNYIPFLTISLPKSYTMDLFRGRQFRGNILRSVFLLQLAELDCKSELSQHILKRSHD